LKLFRRLAAATTAAAFLFAAPAHAADAKAELRPWSGGPTPALTLNDLGGAAHRLEAYKGKVVVINFWATWCEPCREEMPSFNRLKKSLEGQPVALFAVNIAEGEGRINAFLAQVPVDFPVLLDRDSQVSRAWKVRLMPSTFIIGPDGRVRYSYAGERDWAGEDVRSKILALLKEKPERPGR
jgi:thiol-disulfide isomerase/thioredoxin